MFSLSNFAVGWKKEEEEAIAYIFTLTFLFSLHRPLSELYVTEKASYLALFFNFVISCHKSA